MNIINTVADMKEWSRQARGSVGFVPTMGCLHEGHLSLARKSMSVCDHTVVSIFINPAQFGPTEDFHTYPVDLQGDQEKLKPLGISALFLPQRHEIYPEGHKTYVNVDEITSRLCGKSRPALFKGVATVVLKLFNIVRPQVAFFGEKDWQQLSVIKTMVRDLNLDITIEGVPTSREPDGLARSSRNIYLSEAERKSALCLSRSLEAAKALVKQGESSTAKIRDKIQKVIEEQNHTAIDYIALCDPQSFVEQKEVDKNTLLALAVWVGKARLIDNCLIERD
jgi:pantoate--beta-alanine ligase